MSAEEDSNVSVEGLAAVINSRLVAEARIARAIAFGWLCGGAAVAGNVHLLNDREIRGI